jgi:hypothetical protein
MHHPALFSDSRSLHRYVEERGGVVLAWESTPLWLRMTARMKPDLLRSWATMVSTPTGMKRALIVPKAAMSGEDRQALRTWRAQRQNTFQRLNDRGG